MAERGVIFKDDFVSTPGKSWFDMSFDYLFSMNFGELVPSICMECMGGDVIHAKSDSFVRLAPLVAPTFGKANMFSYHFYVRNYSIWKNWRAFYAEGDQRESWQQSINGAFVSPEVPYISIHKTLLRLCGSFVNFPVSTNLDDFIDNGIQFGSDTSVVAMNSDIYALSFQQSYLDWTYRPVSDMHLSNTHEGVVFFVYRNKYETTDILESVYRGVPAGYYNPFSNGSLFDYLGVDLSGHYYKQVDWVRSTILSARTTIHDTNPDLDFTKDVIDGFNWVDFIKNHYVIGMTYIHNQQYCSNTVLGVHTFYGMDDDYKADWLALSDNALVGNVNDGKISTLPLRAYHSIYIDYFRDENYISVNPQIDFARDGEDIDWNTTTPSDIHDYLTLKIKAYEHDPYTTALPQAQRGAPVRFLNDIDIPVINRYPAQGEALRITASNGEVTIANSGRPVGSQYAKLNIDLSAATIENFRFANATQKLLEKVARSGNRYYEYMRAIYGVIVDDAKIDRPIFLGGDKSPIQISEVLQTSASEVTTDQPLGQMAGRGVSVGNDDYIEYITPDAGFFIEICCALPRTNYQQGLSPMFHRFDRLDFPIPDYAQLGEQQVPQRELWYSANDSDDETPFGYQSRYYDYKYQRDRTSGSFKDTLSYWTWSRIFDEAPLAGKEFLEVRPDYRQFAVTDNNAEHIYVHMWHDIQVNRALPVFGTPKL